MNAPAQHNRPLTDWRWMLPLILIQAALIGISAYFPLSVMLTAVGMIVAYVTLKETHLGICVLILFHAVILKQSEEISIVEILFGLYLFLFISVWTFRRVFLKGQDLILFRRDYWLILFLGLCIFSIIPTVVTGNSVMAWFRNLVPFGTLLLYFPASEAFQEPKKRNMIIASFLIVAVSVGIQNIVNYRQNLLEAVFFWEIAGARQVANEPLFLSAIVILTGMLMYSRTFLFRISAVGMLLFFGVALVVTFSRGYWIAAVLGVVIIFLFLDAGRKVKLAALGIVLGLIVFAAMTVLFGDITPFLTKSIAERAGTIAKAQTDISLQNRLVETKAILEKIYRNPIVGYGLGAQYSYLNIITLTTNKTDYAHNVYLYFWFKLGIVGLLSFILFYGAYILAAYRLFRDTAPTVDKGVAAGLIALFLAMLSLSLTSPQFLQKDSLLIITLACGYISSRYLLRGTDTSALEIPG